VRDVAGLANDGIDAASNGIVIMRADNLMKAKWEGVLPGMRVAAVALVLAFAFLGSRGIWDPDEGRYTNVALTMLDTGDWLTPHRNYEVGHWTKPPLTYWAIASSVAAFGKNAWAARLPAALSYLLCVWLTWRIARRLKPGAEAMAALAFATMLLPFGAANMITTDFVLAAGETLSVWGFVEARWGARYPKVWGAVMWFGLALAFMTKGPPGLLPLLPILLFDWVMPGQRRAIQITGLLVFVLFALPWYIAVMLNHPGLFEYFIGDEVVNRVTTNEFGRNGQWYGWLAAYGPALLVGTLPWTASLWPWTRALPVALRRWREVSARQNEARELLLTAWILIPLLVLCLARSRLPLYILPLFVPLAIVVGLERAKQGKGTPSIRWLGLWMIALLAIKLGMSFFPTHKDASAWADAIRQRVSVPVHEVVFVEDMARYGLHLHLGAEIEKLSLFPQPGARFNPTYDEDLAQEFAEAEPGVVYVTKQTAWPLVRPRVEELGYLATPMGSPYQGRILFTVTQPSVPNPTIAGGEEAPDGVGEAAATQRSSDRRSRAR
jgi:hypothetical protein